MRPIGIWFLALAGCADPVLEPVQKALAHYDAGRAALQDGDPETARDAFSAARHEQPEAPSLWVWEAHAARKAGQRTEALQLLTSGLQRWPAHPELRVHRAALFVEAGDLAAGASDLRAAYATGRVHPADLSDDPDFALLAAEESYRSLVPPPAVVLDVRGESGAVLLGDRWTAEVEVVGPLGAPLALALRGIVPDQLELTEVVEDQTEMNPVARTETRTVLLRFRAVKAGEGSLGPFEVAAGPAVDEAPAVPVSVVAVPGRTPGVTGLGRLDRLPLPSQLGPLDPSPSLLETNGAVVLTAPPGATATLVAPDGASLPAVRLELRESGGTRLVRYWVPAGSQGTATVAQGGLTLLEQPLP